MVGPAYFETMGIPVLAGRGFDEDDPGGRAARSVVVNRTFVDTYFSDRVGVGKSLAPAGGGGGAARIVGVVADATYYGLGEEPMPFVYLPGGGSSANFMVAAEGDPSALLGQVRQTLSGLDPLVVPQRLTTFTELRRASLVVQRGLGALTGWLAILALLLTALGVYGAVSFGVTRRLRELGVRMALGANPSRVARLVLARAGLLVGCGLGLGVGGGLVAGRALSGLLFRVAPFDPATFAATAVLVTGVVALASYLPARRAIRVDPLAALREE
jgi:hypothetical protein